MDIFSNIPSHSLFYSGKKNLNFFFFENFNISETNMISVELTQVLQYTNWFQTLLCALMGESL
jgi:hypothetical protein